MKLQLTVGDCVRMLWVATLMVWLWQVILPALIDLETAADWYNFEKDLSCKLDIAIEKQKNRTDNYFTVVVFDRSKLREFLR